LEEEKRRAGCPLHGLGQDARATFREYPYLAEIALAFFNECIKAVEDEVEAWGDFLGVAVGDEPFEGGLDGGGVVVVEDVKRLDGEGGLPPGGDGFPK
jgi:hypothetical protein